MGKKIIAACLLGLTCASQSLAADVKFSGTFFTHYDMITSKHDALNQDSKGRSSFDITRSFFGAEIKTEDGWTGNIVFDALSNGTAAAGTDLNNVYLRSLYLKYSNIMGTGVNAAMGQLQSVWNAYGTAIWGHRYIAAMQSANPNSFTADSDKGFKLDGKLPRGYGNWEVFVANGEASNKTEAANSTTANTAADLKGHKSRGKDISARIAIIPMPQDDLLKNIQLHGVVYQGITGDAYGSQFGHTEKLLGSHRRDKWLAGASFKTAQGHAMAEYWETRTGVGTTQAGGSVQAVTDNITQHAKGYSVHGSYKLPWANLGLMGRYDRVDRAPIQLMNIGGDNRITTGYAPEIVTYLGVTWTPNTNVRLALVNVARNRRDLPATGTQAATFPATPGFGQTQTGFKENRTGLFTEFKF